MEKSKAIDKLEKCLRLLKELTATSTSDAAFKKWRRDTEVAFEHIFGVGTRHIPDFKGVSYTPGSYSSLDPEPAFLKAFAVGRAAAAALLQSIIEEVDEYWRDVVEETVSPSNELPVASNKVFIVHGRDVAAKESVARLIDQLALTPIILHEQPNKGRTIIEKFVDYTDVGFAVVILTGDDRGGPKNKPIKEHQDRARQNVVLELGFFLGRLGRERVCALYQDGVEIPSDYDGVVFIPLDKSGAWRTDLAKEMKAAGLEVDLNNL